MADEAAVLDAPAGEQGTEPGAGAPAAAPSAPETPATPAPDGGTPEGEKPAGEQPPPDDLPDLSEDQLRRINARYGEQLRKLPEVEESIQQTAQQLAQQQRLEEATDPVNNPEYMNIVQEYEQQDLALADHLPQLADMVKALQEERLDDVEPAKLAKVAWDAVTTATRQRDLALAASDHRGVAMIDGLVGTLWGENGDQTVGTGPDGKPITLDGAWRGVLAGYEALRTSEDPKARAAAAGWFARRALTVVHNLGVTKGMAHGRQQAERAKGPELKAAEEAGLREAMAKLGAGHPAQPAGGEESRTGDLTAEEAANLPIDKLIEIRSRQRQAGG